MNIRRVTSVLLMLLSGVALGPAPPAAAATSPCALITPGEASSAMHVTSLPGKFRSGRHGASCRYYSPDRRMNVFIQVVEGTAMIGAAQVGGKPVPGVGDKAIWAAGSLFVQKGGKTAQIGLYLSPESMQRMDPAVVTLGKLAAGRM